MQGRLFMRVVKVVLGIVLVLLLLRGCGALLSGSSGPDDHAAGPSATSPVEPAPSTAPATSPTTETAPSTATQAPASPTSAPPHTPRPTPTAARSTVASGSAAQGVLALPVVGVSDGDTIKVLVDGRTERVRLIGIDTPELSSGGCYAQQATSKMQSLVQSRSVVLTADPGQDDRDRYGRLVRHVSLEDGRLVAGLLIEGGFGREYTYDGEYEHQSDYRTKESRARQARTGLWGACRAGESGRTGDSKVRAAPKPSASAPPRSDAAASGSCDIKGNISAKGEKIYHVPGGRSYAATRISPDKGERMFCSEIEAEAAGWRTARG